MSDADVDALLWVRERCYQEVRAGRGVSVALAQIMHEVQGHLVRTGRVAGAVVGNGEFVVHPPADQAP